MAGREGRLRTNEEFRAVLKGGRPAGNSLAVLYVLRRGGSRRLGVSVPKRLGTAVVRNRVRRLFQEAYRACGPQLSQGFDLVVIPRLGATGMTYDEILRALRDLLSRSGIWVGVAPC
jgi:ribonuclease P protein component